MLEFVLVLVHLHMCVLACNLHAVAKLSIVQKTAVMGTWFPQPFVSYYLLIHLFWVFILLVEK